MGLSCCSKTAIGELAAERILSVGRRFAPSSRCDVDAQAPAMMAATELGLSESAIDKAPAPNDPVPSDAVIAKVQGWPASRAKKISAPGATGRTAPDHGRLVQFLNQEAPNYALPRDPCF